MSARTHGCGKPMTPSSFGHNDPTPLYRSQPIWVCNPCQAWEPRDGWTEQWPEGWDGQSWTAVAW